MKTVILHFDTLGTRLGHGYTGAKGALKVHKRVHDRGTRGDHGRNKLFNIIVNQ